MEHNDGLQEVSNLKTPIMDPRPQKVHQGIIGHALSGSREDYRRLQKMSGATYNHGLTEKFDSSIKTSCTWF